MNRHFFTKFLPALLLCVSAGICQRALVDKSGMITTQMGTHRRSENGRSAWDALYDTTLQQKSVVTSNIHCKLFYLVLRDSRS
jgi:predicted  nucleic acid-binding Zn ribbon protein